MKLSYLLKWYYNFLLLESLLCVKFCSKCFNNVNSVICLNSCNSRNLLGQATLDLHFTDDKTEVKGSWLEREQCLTPGFVLLLNIISLTCF